MNDELNNENDQHNEDFNVLEIFFKNYEIEEN